MKIIHGKTENKKHRKSDNAGAVVFAEEQSGNAILQFLFADGGLMSHVDIIAKALLSRFKVRVV